MECPNCPDLFLVTEEGLTFTKPDDNKVLLVTRITLYECPRCSKRLWSFSKEKGFELLVGRDEG